MAEIKKALAWKEDLDNHKDGLVASQDGVHGLRYDVEEELLIATDADGNEYEIKTGGGAGGAQIEVKTTSDSFVGLPVTISYAGTVLDTQTFNDSKTVAFKVGEYGTYIISCEDEEESVTVSAMQLYQVQIDEAQKATINVSTSTQGFYNQPVTCQSASQTITKNFDSMGKVSFKVKFTEEYTITCKGYSNTVNVVSMTGTYNTEVHIPVSTITITTDDEEFYNASIEVKKDGVAQSTIQFNAVGNASLDVYATGEYTFTVTHEGVEYSYKVVVDELDKNYSGTIGMSLDGNTATPINDVETWLRCYEPGGLSSLGYTTLAQVIADELTLSLLMGDASAMAYLARSTGFATEGCANETFMNNLGSSPHVDDTVLNEDLWVEAICDSQYMDKVFIDLIPTLSSYSDTDVGSLIYYDTDSRAPIWQAFDKNIDTFGNTNVPNIGYRFNKNIVYAVLLKKISYSRTGVAADFWLEASNAGDSWVKISDDINIEHVVMNNKYFINNSHKKYMYYRTNCKVTIGTPAKYSFYKIQFYGR